MHYVNQSGSSIEFEVIQPTNPIPPNLRINFCNGSFGITITSASGQSNTAQQMWGMMCDFENGRAQMNLDIESFPGPTTTENYTVVFNISFYFDGIIDPCYLQLEVDNVTVNKGEQ